MLGSSLPSPNRWFPSLARIAPKEFRQRSLLDLSLGNAHHDLLESAFARLRDIEAVQAQEDKRRGGASALVPIHEGVILGDVKEVGSGHGLQILV